MKPEPKKAEISGCREMAPGVYQVEMGRWVSRCSIYFVRSGSSWALIDAGWAKCGRTIKRTAESVFGANARPASILLTHIHPDHSGSARELAQMWKLPVYVHSDEMPLAPGGLMPEYFNSLDRWLVAPLMKLMPRRVVESQRLEAGLKDIARPLEPDTGVPGLSDWEFVHTPGHTPGHVVFFRSHDRVLIGGDALLTVNTNSLWDFLLNKQQVSGPPYIGTWKWDVAKASVAVLARLEPNILACGHGVPMTGEGVARELCAFADRFSGRG